MPLNLKRLFTGSNSKDTDPPANDRFPESGIVEFYGKWCGYCRMIESDVERLQVEGADMLRLEVWGDRDNKRLMEGLSGLIDEFNRGNYTVPMFYDARKPREQQLLVNPFGYEEIVDWMGDHRVKVPANLGKGGGKSRNSRFQK